MDLSLARVNSSLLSREGDEGGAIFIFKVRDYHVRGMRVYVFICKCLNNFFALFLSGLLI